MTAPLTSLQTQESALATALRATADAVRQMGSPIDAALADLTDAVEDRRSRMRRDVAAAAALLDGLAIDYATLTAGLVAAVAPRELVYIDLTAEAPDPADASDRYLAMPPTPEELTARETSKGREDMIDLSEPAPEPSLKPSIPGYSDDQVKETVERLDGVLGRKCRGRRK